LQRDLVNGVGATDSGAVIRPAVESFNSPNLYMNPLAAVLPTVMPVVRSS